METGTIITTAAIVTLIVSSVISSFIKLMFDRLGKKIDANTAEQAIRAAEHWEFESTTLNSQLATSDLTLQITEFSISQGCNGNTKELQACARKSNTALKELIQKRATKNV